jgi:hypothetical protein
VIDATLIQDVVGNDLPIAIVCEKIMLSVAMKYLALPQRFNLPHVGIGYFIAAPRWGDTS